MKLWLANLLKTLLFKVDPNYYKGPTFSVTPKGIWPKKRKAQRLVSNEDLIPEMLEDYHVSYWNRKAKALNRISLNTKNSTLRIKTK